ncbi:MAG: putative creatinine amidohydrolase [Acidimicrobiales bacterium]|nr:putative creatinine amidohydrolase [Acidimicrobiales bacterium]
MTISPTPRTRHLADLTGPDVSRLLTEDSIIVQPLGAIEQHGPHLPLNTDLIIAEATADATAASVGDELDVWVLPPLAYTKSNEHAWSPGTIWLSSSTLQAVLGDIGRCIAKTPAKRLVFLNGHGGNSTLLGTANREIRLEHGLMTFTTHPGVPADQGGTSAEGEHGMGIHGGTDETSVMLHLAPHLCDMSKAERRIPEGMIGNRYVKFGGKVSFGWLSNDFFDDGYIGDPTMATAELGRELFDGSVVAFSESLREIRDFNFGR